MKKAQPEASVAEAGRIGVSEVFRLKRLLADTQARFDASKQSWHEKALEYEDKIQV